MKIERTKEWWLDRARREADAAVGAGLLALDPIVSVDEQRRSGRAAGGTSTAAHSSGSAIDETRIAFSRFVELSRRERGLSVEKLAEQADLDVGELVNIEEDLDYRPDPRTVFQLARTFSVPQKALMQLAGLVVANDDHLRQEAVRFAARSESVEKLTREEKAALNAFVAVLSQSMDKSRTR